MGDDEELMFGVLDLSIFDYPLQDQIAKIEDCVENFSYSELNPPHFTKLFTFLVRQFASCTDLNILAKLADVLGNISGYKLGLNVRNVFSISDNLMLSLLSSPDRVHIASAVNFFRKTARVLGPRFVFQNFAKQNASKPNSGTGIAILVHQLLIDFPKFRFELEDFDRWVYPLSAISGVGYQLVNEVRNKVPDFDDYDKSAVKRPPSVPMKLGINPSVPSLDKPPPLPPNSARPTVCPRLLPRRNSTRVEGTVFQLTEKQNAVREFIDAPFQAGENVVEMTNTSVANMMSKEWEDRSASFNTVKRVLRYQPEMINDDHVHTIVTATLEDVESPRAALSLSAIGLLQETIKVKPAEMELEIARVIPIIMKRFSKSAQFFEAALTEFMNTTVKEISPKRLVPLMVMNGESKSPKVQSAVAEYMRDSLMKCINRNESLLRKNSKDLTDLIAVLYKLLSGSSKATRDPAKECISLLSRIYGGSFSSIVQKSLEQREAVDFLRAVA